MINEWDITTTNLFRASKRHYEVAVLPTGAIEAHNRHLPEGIDYLHTTHIARRACEMAWPKCESVVCLPALPFGVDCNQLAFPLAISVTQATLDRMIREILTSLKHHGIRKTVIVNGHGGNDFVPLIRQVQCDLDVHVFLCNWWTVGQDRWKDFFDKSDDHAGQFETSVAMHMFPELVEPGVAGSGVARPFRFEALNKGYVRTSRDFARLNDHCSCGDPTGSNAQRAKGYMDLVCQRLSDFLAELANSPIDKNFPHVD